MRCKHPRQYLAQAGTGGAIQEAHAVPVRDLAFEFMMNALRLTEGFPLVLFEERTGLSLATILEPLDAAERDGLLSVITRSSGPRCAGGVS